jgi:hypothetical protein
VDDPTRPQAGHAQNKNYSRKWLLLQKVDFVWYFFDEIML